MFDTIIQILHGFQIDRKCKLSFKHFGYIQKRPGMQEINFKSREGRLQGTFISSISEQKLNSIIEQLDNKQIQSKISIALKTGGQFKDYGQFQNVFDHEKTKLAHHNNQVMLIYVWATWSAPSQKGIKFNQHLLHKNQEKWKDKVSIVGVSLDQNRDTIKKRVIEKKWEKVKHLTLLGWKEDHPLITDYKIQEIPFVCLINKWGKIDYVGNPIEIDIQKRINQLLAEESDYSITQNPYIHPQDTKEKVDCTNPTYHTIFNLSEKQVQKYFNDTDFVIVRYQFENILNNGVYKSTFNVSGFILDNQGEQNKVAELFGKPQNMQMKLEKVKYVKVPNIQHPDCFFCDSKALNYPYYWLNFEEGDAKFGCRTCVQKKSTVEGHHYFYQKNSILLNGPWSMVGLKDIGKNHQPTDYANFKNTLGFKCNICGSGNNSVGHARYANLGARADPFFGTEGKVDFCEDCIQKLITKEVEVCNRMYTQQGILYNFPHLRILYRVVSYSDY